MPIYLPSIDSESLRNDGQGSLAVMRQTKAFASVFFFVVVVGVFF